MQQTLVAAAVAGIVVVGGGVGYAVGSSDLVDVAGAASAHLPHASADYHACPGSGPLGQLHRGDRVLLTGVDDTGGWYELRSPIDLLDRVWVPASTVTPDDDVAAALPERACGLTDEELTLATGEPVEPEVPEDEADEPEEEVEETTTTAPVDPGGPTTAPPTTAAPGQPSPPSTQPPVTSPPTTVDRTGPTITGFTRGAPHLREQSVEFCERPASTEVSVTVTDPAGVGTVTLHWSEPDALGRTQVAMTRHGSTYRAVLGPFRTGTLSANGTSAIDLGWRVTAHDGAGNTRTVTAPASAAVVLENC